MPFKVSRRGSDKSPWDVCGTFATQEEADACKERAEAFFNTYKYTEGEIKIEKV